MMTKSHTATILSCMQKLVFLLAAAPWMFRGVQAQEQKAIPVLPHPIERHLCGGVGDESLKQLQAQASQFNLGFWMVTGPSGAYLADIPIQIQSDRQTVASFIADGPLCYVKLPIGRYTVTGTHNGQTRSVLIQSGSMNNYLRW